MKCGLLGEKLTHSYSPQIHSRIDDYEYKLFELQADELSAFFAEADFTGINVTIPYKKVVLPYCSQLSECAKRLGSVNTIIRRGDGSLLGHNTDYFGFQYLLAHTQLQVKGKKVLVLGSGGASVTVVAVLEELGADIVVISRNGKNNYQNIALHHDTALIVNTTPVGMFPNNGSSPVDLSLFAQLEGVIDIIYNPSRTKLLIDAEKRGLVAENGLRMLVAQAVESAMYFTGRDIPCSIIEEIYHTMSLEMENIVLIGMPGSGKSTVGQYLAQRLGRRFVDADTQIEITSNMAIPQIFAQQGESGFRKIETEVLGQLCKQSGLVIATGGGCVTVEDNYELLHQNSKIIWLQRNIDLLPTCGRPLSQITDLSVMYKTREPMYRRFSDETVLNDGDISETANQVISAFQRRITDAYSSN